MKNNGFTLIELLAVIVILAIIALIVVPIVVNIINDSKNESEKRSINLYLDAVEKAIVKQNFKTKYDPDECIIQENNKLKCSKNFEEYQDELEVDIKGDIPISGTLIVENGKVIDILDIALNNKFYSYDSNKKIIESSIPQMPGLYDKQYKLLASWDKLIKIYKLNIEKYYDSNTYKEKDSGSMYDVLTNNDELSSATFLITSHTINRIGAYNFYNCNLEKVIINDGITNIGQSAFEETKNLKEVILPNTLTYIGSNAFGNSALTNIKIPKSVTYLGGGIFRYCKNLESVIFEKGINLNRINNGTFIECTNLKNIELPNSITGIESYAFSLCLNLKSIKIPNNVTYIGQHAFQGTGLTSITIPKNVENLADEPFYDCKSLEKIEVSDENLIYEDQNSNAIIKKDTSTLIQGCKNTIIPGTVTSIGQYAFYGIKDLKNIILPNSVISIDKKAFAYSGLITITITNNITLISIATFQGCDNLKSIIFEDTVGWKAGENEIDVTNSSQNATYLKNNYVNLIKN